MEEKKHDCEQENKRVSKRYLAFYIIALFSVALVIILLSYLTQLRADRELANMNTALAQKDTTVQGTQEKMIALQDTLQQQAAELETMQKQLDEIRAELGTEGELLPAVQQRMDEHDAYQKLLELGIAAAKEEKEAAKICIDYLEATYGAGRLDGTAENAVFTGNLAEQYLKLKAQMG